MRDKYALVRSVKSDMSLSEALTLYDIRAHVLPLEACIKAFVYRSRKGQYHIIANENLSSEEMNRVFWHEIYHIIEDMPRLPYYVGIDQHRHSMEHNADKFYEFAAAYAVG